MKPVKYAQCLLMTCLLRTKAEWREADKRHLHKAGQRDYHLDNQRGRKDQNSSYKINKSWRSNVQYGDQIIDNTIFHVSRKLILKILITRKNA